MAGQPVIVFMLRKPGMGARLANRVNKSLWSYYYAYAEHRGWLVTELLSQKMALVHAKIADMGCGAGGASLQLARRGAKVTAIDRQQDLLLQLGEAAQKEHLAVTVQCRNLNDWQAEEPLNAILLWDVLEHVADPLLLLQHCREFLKPNGLIWLSTPNKWSPLNLICDPHTSLPLLACCRRATIKKILVNRLHWFQQDKDDIAQLFSWSELQNLLSGANLDCQWVVKQVTGLALQKPESVWNRPWHLWVIRQILAIGLQNSLIKCAPEKPRLLNRWLLPTFYLMAYKT
jgi:2-polyprenyl-3-methyl-5-hydroxy-6-metoxy-1,4-benzoquinol methylase